jgi:hypothetical protein
VILFQAREADGYDALVTTDQNLRYQQNLAGRVISILVLMSTSRPRLSQRIPEIQTALNGLGRGEYGEVNI